MSRSTSRRRPRAASLALSLLAAAAALLGACRTAAPASGAASGGAPDSLRIRRDVEHLASDRLEGRGTGTAGNDSAAAFLARRMAEAGLRPAFPTSGADGYLQRFVARSAVLAHAGQGGELRTQNVVGVVPGTDPSLAGRPLVIGAHFDHLGRGGPGVLDPQAAGAVRNGADDNASGTAAVLELARLVSRRPLRRPLVVALFSGEELGLLGSQHLVQSPPLALDSAAAMLNFDMVGRLRDGRLMVYGVATAAELPALLDAANAALPGGRLDVRGIGDGFGPSDHSSFYARGMPVLHFFTDVHDDYHRATDDADKVSAAGVARVVALADGVLRRIDAGAAPLTFVRAAAPVAGGSRAATQAYLGSVPDMGAVDVVGLRLTAVRPDSPAERGGLRAGDVIVEFDGRPVTDLQSYSDALYARQPGDQARIVVRRGAERVAVTVTLGRRGG